jgi:hypothetical protein
MAALISVTPLLAPSLSMSWTSRTRISSLIRGPSLVAGCGSLIGRRMGLISLNCCYWVVQTLPAGIARYHESLSTLLIGERRRSGVFAFKSTTMRGALHDPA